ncbi:C-type mannose receptor 2 [Collichthys lucidus]|uniref:C-type mannose receptor 2 n=1 Tax=Collichthys lucidus TaxID=240159 RepID=A0A4U5VWF5_COLLU|nr:C-type mannose receptor 2 [Collichthys lucidus]
MEMGTFGILILSGLCNLVFSSIRNREYHFVSDAKTWLDAQKYCRMKYKDLAPVNDEQDLGKLSDVVPARVSAIFIGLHRNWSWSLSDTDDYKAGEESYWNWASGQPGIGDCGTIDGLTGEWSAIDCSTRLNFTCYHTVATDNSQRFTLIKTPKTWLDAQAYCRRYYTDLARVRDQLENDAVRMMVKDGLVWIGLTQMSWMWSDGSETWFLPWKPLKPQAYGVADCSVLVISDPPVLVRTKLGDPGTTTELKLTWWKLPELKILKEKTPAPQPEALCLR